MTEKIDVPFKARLSRYALLTVQLVLLIAVFHLYHVEEPAFFILSVTAVGGFLVHYWLPRRYQEPFFVALSFVATFLVLEPFVAALLIGVGLVLFGIVRLPLGTGPRTLLALGFLAALLLGRGIHAFGLPEVFWATAGAIFMFRTIVYLYDLRSIPAAPKFIPFASYFYLLPNYYFLLFPVVDYQTMRRSFHGRDIHVVAQEGIRWMVRGTVQLLAYRLVLYLRGNATPDVVTSLPALGKALILTFLLYLRVSGSFHLIIGMLKLFGYDLPETNRNYLLARSLTDFWRRINIYWKDFMVKVVYFPVYFARRRKGEVQAQILATGAVFLVTWALHVYQYYWLSGRVLLSVPDVLFWAILGSLVVVNVLVEVSRKRASALASRAPVRRVAQTVGTGSLIVVLWSMWNAPSIRAWIDLITYWRVG